MVDSVDKIPCSSGEKCSVHHRVHRHAGAFASAVGGSEKEIADNPGGSGGLHSDQEVHLAGHAAGLRLVVYTIIRAKQ